MSKKPLRNVLWIMAGPNQPFRKGRAHKAEPDDTDGVAHA